MQEFILTSKKFNGYMRFGYNSGVLQLFENHAQLDERQLDFFEHNLPFRLENLEKIKGTTGIIHENTDLTFETFWNKYEYKVDRISAEEHWKKMSDEEKLKAISGIARYKYRCKIKNIATIYPVRYLRKKRWEDEQ